VRCRGQQWQDRGDLIAAHDHDGHVVPVRGLDRLDQIYGCHALPVGAQSCSMTPCSRNAVSRLLRASSRTSTPASGQSGGIEAADHTGPNNQHPHARIARAGEGIDGSPASELATAIAFDEASMARRRSCGAARLEWCWPDFPDVEASAIKATAEEALAERLAGWRERYPDVTVQPVLKCGYPARHLLEESKSAQLVVVGSHGRGGFAGMLLGSVSTAVVHGAQVPVIVARQG
jgi:nucleotide-binding universal stress UspA family protein